MDRLLIRFHGVFEERTRRRDEVLELANPNLKKVISTLGGMYGRRFQQALWDDSRKVRPGVSVLVNGRPADWDAQLKDGDEIVFATPLGGFHG